MFKRILEIIIYPFYLLYLIFSFPFKIVKIIFNDKKGKSNRNKVKSSKDNSFFENQIDLLEAGQLLFPNIKTEFIQFFNLFLADKNNFLSEKKELLEGYSNFELEKIKAIEVIYIFGDSNGLLWITDWTGEENEREIENFLETKLKIKSDWTNANDLREEVNEEKQRDEKFIIDLLKTIDKDLEPLNKKLIFFDLSWDAYVYTVVDQTSSMTIIDNFGTLFHGTEKLIK
jgi:hypothetical protein